MNMENRKIPCVSFPRSGHHLLGRCLKQYFGRDFHYCPNVFRKAHFKDPKTNYQKNHDFDLSLPNTRAWYYVIQYRHPLTRSYHGTNGRPILELKQRIILGGALSLTTSCRFGICILDGIRNSDGYSLSSSTSLSGRSLCGNG
jgi:hypothetical protein